MIRLDYRDSRPIYEQVRDGLRRLMVTGVMQPGEQLPSVRRAVRAAAADAGGAAQSRLHAGGAGGALEGGGTPCLRQRTL